MTDPKIDETENFVTAESDAPKVKEDVKEEAKEPEATKEPEPEKEPEKEVTSNDDAASDNTTVEQAKKKGGVQKRIDGLVREREDEKRKNESLTQTNKELQEKLKAQSEPEKKSKEPIEDDFDTYDEYLDALDKHEKASSSTEQKPKVEPVEDKPEQESADKEQPLTDAQRTAMAVLQEKVIDAAEKFTDFDEVALAKDVDITGEMLEALAECENPADVMYHLGKNKTLASKIAGMSPIQQMRQITQLDLGNVQTPKPVKQTNASDPISPVGGSDVQEKSLSEMPFSEFEAARNKQEQEQAGSW